MVERFPVFHVRPVAAISSDRGGGEGGKGGGQERPETLLCQFIRCNIYQLIKKVTNSPAHFEIVNHCEPRPCLVGVQT
jgi:hypothetical protein